MKKTRCLYSLFILVCLISYILYAEKENTSSPIQKKKQRIFSFSIDEIERIEIKKKGKQLFLFKKDGLWHTNPKVSFTQEGIESFVSQLCELERVDIVEKNPKDLSKYGLDPPRIKIALWKKGTKSPLYLFIGKKSPTSLTLYVKKGKDPSVMLVGNLIDFFLEYMI